MKAIIITVLCLSYYISYSQDNVVFKKVKPIKTVNGYSVFETSCNKDSNICNYLVLDESESKVCRFDLKDSIVHSFLMFYSNSDVKFNIPYSRGKIWGQVKAYYSQSRIKVQYTYVENVLDGEFIYYRRTGKVWFKGNYVKGILDENSIKYLNKRRKRKISENESSVKENSSSLNNFTN